MRCQPPRAAYASAQQAHATPLWLSAPRPPSPPPTEHVLRAGGLDDDLRAHGGHADLHARIPVFGQFSVQQLVELGVEHTIGNELRIGGARQGASAHMQRARLGASRAELRCAEQQSSITPACLPLLRDLGRHAGQREERRKAEGQGLVCEQWECEHVGLFSFDCCLLGPAAGWAAGGDGRLCHRPTPSPLVLVTVMNEWV